MSAPILLLLVLALLVALAAAAVLSSQPTRLLSDLVVPHIAASPDVTSVPAIASSPTPTDAPSASTTPLTDPHALLVVTSRVATVASDLCTNVDRISIDAGTRDRVIDCAARVRLRDDGSEAAVQGTKGLDFVDLRTGRTTDMLDTGTNTFAIAWSPSGRWIQWESCKDYASGPCTVVLSARDGSNAHELYKPSIPGYIGFTAWTPDESTVRIPTEGQGVLVGDGDGSDLHRTGEEDFRGLWDDSTSWVPDGSGYLYLEGPATGSCANFCVAETVDVWEQPMDGGPARNLTSVIPGDLVVAAAMSPDGQQLAFLKKHVNPALDVYRFSREAASRPAQLWIRDATGAVRLIDTPRLLPIDDRSGDGRYALHWAADGAHIAIEASNGLRGSDASIDTYIVPLDGSATTVLEDARQAAWSPDGTMIGVVHDQSPPSRTEDDPVPTRAVDVAASDGTGRREVAPLKGDGGYFVWAPR
jgi:Tol biopolymer transport system component